MKKTIILCLALALFSSPVLASTTSCTNGSRSAQNEEGYCEEKAKELVEKQLGWGWSCKEAAAE
jgi:hypothetical protein